MVVDGKAKPRMLQLRLELTVAEATVLERALYEGTYEGSELIFDLIAPLRYTLANFVDAVGEFTIKSEEM